MQSNSQNKMLDLLGQAYQAVDDSDKIDDLMDDISDYLFEEPNSATISKNLPDYAGFDPHLERHIGQLNNLMSKQADEPKNGLSLAQHAQLIFSPTGQILTANSHARKLLNDQYKGYLDDLPLSITSITAIRELIKEVAAGVQDVERILYLQIEAEPVRSAFGFCRAVEIGDDKMGVHISLSYFEWTPEIFKNLENALGLSATEGLVLQGVLKGQSRNEIAAARGRTIGTIKSQAKAVLLKAGCKNLNELAHLCTSIAYIIGLTDAQKLATKPQTLSTPKQAMRILPMPNGRQLAYYEYGDPNGKPVLYFHGFYQGPFFLDSMKRQFLKHGLRIIAPSRPHFGHTTAPSATQDYVTTTNNDMLALLAHLKLEQDISIMAHHAGGSFAFRFAKHIEQKLTGMVLVGAGIPITNEHIQFMGKQARMAAAASRHAPSLMRMLISLAVKKNRKNGIEAMLDKSYVEVGRYVPDHDLLHNNITRPKLAEGLQHLIEQGAEAFVHDGRAQMLDWTAEYEAVNCQQLWIMGRHCPVMGAHFVEDYVQSGSNHSVQINEKAGYHILFQSFDLVIENLLKIQKI